MHLQKRSLSYENKHLILQNIFDNRSENYRKLIDLDLLSSKHVVYSNEIIRI